MHPSFHFHSSCSPQSCHTSTRRRRHVDRIPPAAGFREFRARLTQPPPNIIFSRPLGGNDNNSGFSTVISINACIPGKKERKHAHCAQIKSRSLTETATVPCRLRSLAYLNDLNSNVDSSYKWKSVRVRPSGLQLVGTSVPFCSRSSASPTLSQSSSSSSCVGRGHRNFRRRWQLCYSVVKKLHHSMIIALKKKFSPRTGITGWTTDRQLEWRWRCPSAPGEVQDFESSNRERVILT